MRRILFLAAAAALLPAAAAPPPITMELNSWGHRIYHWTIRPDGSIVTGQVAGGRLDGKMVDVSAPASPARYRWVAETLAPVAKVAGRELPCRLRMTDTPYGTVRWGTGKPFTFNTGCTYPAAGSAAMDALDKVNAQIDRWVKGTGASPPPRT